MPVNFTAPEGATMPKTDGSMFAPTPLWDRAPKKRRRGAAAAARRPRNDPAMDAGEPGAGAGVLGATTAAEPLDPVYETHPPVLAHASRTGAVAGAIAVGVVVVAALGGVGWYASQSRAHGVAELTPGTPATSQMALNTAAPPVNPTPAASAPAPVSDSASTPQDSSPATVHRAIPAAPRNTAKSVATRTPTPRVRPADSSSALSSGVDASTTAPMINTPAPSPSASPMQATPPVNPAVPAPAPATTTSPPAGSTDDSAAPTASAPAAPTATP